MYRGDPRGTVFGFFSTSQFISVVLGPLSLFMLFWLSRRVPHTPEQDTKRRRVAA